MSNPYDPQSPAKPDYFGGRKHILDVARQRIDKAVDQKQSGGILVFGHRGVGKTSLVNKIISMTHAEKKSENILTIYRRLSKTTSDSEIYQIITEDLIEEINQRKNMLEKVKDVAKKISSAKAFEIEFTISDEFKQKSSFHKWRSLIRNLKEVDFILVAIDDADNLSHEALGELKTIVEEQQSTPIILLVSGGIEFESKLVEEYSPIARVFSGASFNLGEFTVDETKEVLEKPLHNRPETKWTNDGIQEVQELSRGYPYLVQCIANASFIEKGSIDATKVSGSLDYALTLGSPWLNHELKSASDTDISCFLRIIELNSDILKNSEMSKAGVPPVYIGRLVRLKVIEQISRGRYKLIKPPIVAFYHSLKRGLTSSINRKGTQSKLKIL
jgi:type II secretory pathway predicted ATPase ExeA